MKEMTVIVDVGIFVAAIIILESLLQIQIITRNGGAEQKKKPKMKEIINIFNQKWNGCLCVLLKCRKLNLKMFQIVSLVRELLNIFCSIFTQNIIICHLFMAVDDICTCHLPFISWNLLVIFPHSLAISLHVNNATRSNFIWQNNLCNQPDVNHSYTWLFVHCFTNAHVFKITWTNNWRKWK